MKYVLASKSPRRIKIFKSIAESFEIFDASVDETITQKASAEEQTAVIAERKARKAAGRFQGCYVIAADTVVVSPRGEILGKPDDIRGAVKMLTDLNGRVHKVVTSIAVITPDGELCEDTDTAEVEFNELTVSQIEEYAALFKPLDKAGAYGVQDAFPLVKRIDGDYYTVMGLSPDKLRDILLRIDGG